MIGMLILIPVIGIPATVAYFQETNAGLIFIEEAVRRQVFGWDSPASAFVAMDGLFCFTLVPAMIALWKWQERRGREPGEQGKIAIGYLLTALASLLMVVPAAWIDHDPAARVSMLWPFLLYLLNAVGFLYYWPTLLALFSRTAPRTINATMMGWCSSRRSSATSSAARWAAGGMRCRMSTSSCCTPPSPPDR